MKSLSMRDASFTLKVSGRVFGLSSVDRSQILFLLTLFSFSSFEWRKSSGNKIRVITNKSILHTQVLELATLLKK